MSVLFKSVAISIPQSIKAWDIGVLGISHIHAHTVPSIGIGDVEVIVDNVVVKTASPPAISRLNLQGKDDGKSSGCLWTCDPILEWPILHRHQTAAIFKIRSNGEVVGEAVAWLSSIPDNETVHLNLPLHDRELSRLRENNYSSISGISYADPKRNRRHRQDTSAANISSPYLLPSPIGHLEIELRFEPGISFLHRSLIEQESVVDIEYGTIDCFKAISP